MKIKNFFTALLVLLSIGAAGAAVYFLPVPDRQERDLKSVVAADGAISLICTGGAERLIPQVGNVNAAEERIQGWAGAFLAGVDLQAAAATWIPGGSQSGKAISANILGKGYSTTSGLSVPALRGAAFVKRSGSEHTISGANAHLAQSGDLRGIANNPCRWASTAAWFVGGNVKVGAASRLLLVNPSANPMLIHISQYTENGKAELGSGSNVTLAPHGAKSLSLDGILVDSERSALHVYSDSGFFAASLQTNSLAGYTPHGIDFIDAGISGKELVIPALHLPAASGATANLPDAAARGEESRLVAAGVTGTLRIVNTEEKPQQVRVFLVDKSGNRSALPGSEEVKVAGQSVLDLNLDGIKPGDYSLFLEANTNIAAGVEIRYKTDAGVDNAWLAAQPEFRNSAAAFALGNSRLVITPTAPSTRLSWEAFAESGKSIGKDELSLQGTTGIELPAAAHYVTIKAERPIYGGIVLEAKLASGKGIDWIPLTPDIASSSSFSLHGVN